LHVLVKNQIENFESEKNIQKIEKEILIDWQFLAEKDVYIPPDLAFAGLCIPRNENSNYPLKVDFAIID